MTADTLTNSRATSKLNIRSLVLAFILIVTLHAFIGHQVEPLFGYHCFQNNGSSAAYLTLGDVQPDGTRSERITWLCFDGKNWYALVTDKGAYRPDGEVEYRQITSFQVRYNVDKFVDNLTINRGGTPFSGSIQVGKFFLSTPSGKAGISLLQYLFK